jgi:hypothetical protein
VVLLAAPWHEHVYCWMALSIFQSSGSIIAR